MLVGASETAAIILAGLTLATGARGPAGDHNEPSRWWMHASLLRRSVVMCGLICAAVCAGYQLEALYRICPHGLFGDRSEFGLSVCGAQSDRLYVLHIVPILGVACAACASVARCRRVCEATDRTVGVLGLFTVVSACTAIQWTFPNHILDDNHAILAYGFGVPSLVGVPACLVLIVASCLLLLRKPLDDVDDECDGPACASCGYNLTGNTSGRCPECGSAIRTELRRVSTRPAIVARVSSHKRWPRGMVWACYVFAGAWSAITTIRQWDYPAVGAIRVWSHLPAVDVGALFWFRPMLLPILSVTALNFTSSVMLVIIAHGLRNHRRWAVLFCWLWLVIVIPAMLWDAVATGAGMIYGLSPGRHTDPAMYRIVLERAALGAGFPIILALWLSQRHVRWQMARWRRR